MKETYLNKEYTEFARLGNPILYNISDPVDLSCLDEAKKIVDFMIYRLDCDGKKTGLAAPQIFIPKRIVVFRIPEKSQKYHIDCESVPLTTMINPQFEPLSDEMNLNVEACISIPGLMGFVPRYTNIKYSFYDINGKKVERMASNFHARVVQHECDHLDGILFINRMTDLKTLGFEKEILKNICDNNSEKSLNK